ncbi:NAC domain-containing protein 74-like isoform X1 [Carex littledalei]|uniref:NAC domain-containing protein 74-like isoform X1 n=1 Tax=Carex littledalei TaxID=544730 RepID=A0A833RK42_9POAL|nr:NAC domain-containing protein 74-like isoform X1 [Carex littledalei]
MAMKGTSLPPGFRFHPTDNELVLYYLKRKLTHKPFHFEAVTEIDLYKYAPWELPEKSCLRTRDRVWYFFCARDRKYTNGMRTNRATSTGYWKTTGNDRPVVNNSRTVGMKKTLVFHRGKAPRGERTDWVMYEYRIEDPDLVSSGIQLDAFVVCKIFHKSGMGPKAGEQYGAPFDEEEWEDAELHLPTIPMPSVTIAVPSTDNNNTSSSLHLNNPVQSTDLQVGPTPPINPCPLQAHTSSGVDCNGTGGKESPSSVDELSFDIVHLQEVLQASAPPIEDNYNNAPLDAEDAIFENLDDSSGETGANLNVEMYHSDDYDMVNGNAFDPTTILSELANENFVELSDFLSALGLASDTDGVLMSKDSFKPNMCSYYSPHFR